MPKEINLGDALKTALAASSFAEATAKRDAIEAELSEIEAVLKRFPRSSVGLVSDAVRVTPEYQAAKAISDRLVSRLRSFNESYVKKFAKELREARNERRRLMIREG